MSIHDKSTHPAQSFFQILERRTGRMTAAVFCTVGLWYFLAHTAVFARLWAELLRSYLAPGALTAALAVLPILGGLVLLWKGRGLYARAGRYLEFALAVLAAVFLWLAGDKAQTAAFQDGPTYPERFGTLLHTAGAGRRETVTALFLLIALFLVVAGGLRCIRAAYDYLYAQCAVLLRGQTVRGIRERLWENRKKTAGISAADVAAGIGETPVTNGMISETQKLFGTELAGELSVQPDEHKPKFYGIKGTKNLPALPGAGKISFYGGRIAEELSAVRICWWIVVLMLYALTAGFADAFAAVAFYRAYNLQILIPVLLMLYVYMLLFAGSKHGQPGA